MTTTIFYYLISNLLALASRESVEALSSARADDGTPIVLDQSVLRLSDTTMFKRMLQTVATKIFQRVSRYSRDVTTPYQFDADYDGNPGYVIYELLFAENWDSSQNPVLNIQFRDALVLGVLAEWFSFKRKNFLSQYYEQAYSDLLDSIKSTVELRTKINRPSYYFGPYYVFDEEV